jgi:hypothetical protein
MKRTAMILVIGASFAISARGQGFLNLDFESAYNLTNSLANGSALVSVTNALPDWTAYDDLALLSDIYYTTNNLSSQSSVEFGGAT